MRPAILSMSGPREAALIGTPLALEGYILDSSQLATALNSHSGVPETVPKLDLPDLFELRDHTFSKQNSHSVSDGGVSLRNGATRTRLATDAPLHSWPRMNATWSKVSLGGAPYK